MKLHLGNLQYGQTLDITKIETKMQVDTLDMSRQRCTELDTEDRHCNNGAAPGALSDRVSFGSKLFMFHSDAAHLFHYVDLI